MTTLLEERYRRALLLLPATYRDRWGEDMVTTFLEGAHAAAPDDPEAVDISRPSVAELASIAALAVRLRVGGVEAPARPRLWGDAVRLLALLGLLFSSALSLAGALFTGWRALRLPSFGPVDLAPTRLQIAVTLLGLLWVAAFASVLYGHYRSGRLLAVAALAVDLIVFGVDLTYYGFGSSLWLEHLVRVGTVVALMAYGRRTPVRPSPGTWLVSATATALALVGCGLLINTGWELDLTDVASVALVLTALVVRRRNDPPWALAMPLAATVTLALWLIRTENLLTILPRPVLVLGVFEAAGLIAVGIDGAVRARRHWRLLPSLGEELSPPDGH